MYKLRTCTYNGFIQAAVNASKLRIIKFYYKYPPDM